MDIKKLCIDAAKQLQNPSEVKLEVRGGNSGVVTPQGEVFADSPGQCLRNITLRAYGISEPISLKTQITFHLGYAWEQLFEKLLRASDGVTDVQTQLNVREEGSIPWSGTADFVATVNGRRTLFDTKSISSLNSYVSVFFEGKVKVSYVSQMVRYMTALKISQGYLVFASFIYVGKGNVTAGQYRKMGEVSANPDIKTVQISIVGGGVYVDGFPWEYTLTDVLEHTNRAQNNLHNEIVEPYRPAATGSFSPCYSCHFNKACSTFEASGSKDLQVFLKLAKEI